MIKSKSDMAMTAVQRALKVRTQNGIDIKNAFCIYDLVEKNDIELRFIDIPSLEGMYVSQPKKTILICSLRPAGRQRFTCAHELGHHFFKHGKHIDEYVDDGTRRRNDPHETMADLFAAYVLMPATTVVNGFVRRGWQMEAATPLQVYAIACWLGVGYSTLINHLHISLKKISLQKTTYLLRFTPKELKKELLNKYYPKNVILVDKEWTGRPIDLFTGDIILSDNVIEVNGTNFELLGSINGRFAFKALHAGICSIHCKENGWSSFARVSNASYVGRGKFRHLEDG